MPDLARLESEYHRLSAAPAQPPGRVSALALNPDLILFPTQWTNLPALLKEKKGEPMPVQGHILIWRHPLTGALHCRDAEKDDLLALKLTAEQTPPREAARQGKVPLSRIQAVLHNAVESGLLIKPESGINRDPDMFAPGPDNTPFLSTDVFTLQWHITQACDLHCRHCYDRSDRKPLALADARSILDDFFDFSQAMNVRGHVTFTGGNPLLHPDFFRFYQGAADRGFSTAVLGNPAREGILDRLRAIQLPTHYQVSLEGLQPYNDYIRGDGHFLRTLDFLDSLRKKGIYAMVMLTLNRDNMDQVLPLAEMLRNRADSFTFNRLAMVGEGKNLRLPDPGAFTEFLADYLAALPTNPILRLKDNLFNILARENRRHLNGGCTGHGCGAAFNFISLLPDGDVHACRKFPSRIGSIKQASLLEIYQSRLAARYRQGPSACRTCDLWAVCRGCPAVIYSMGLDCFEDRDPFCSYLDAPSGLAGH